jgi:Ca2+-binding RTX toxin-like protein
VTNAGTAVLSGVSGVETIALSNGGANTLVLHDANFGGVTGRKITVLDGNAGDTVTAALLVGDTVALHGGSGNDSFFFAAAGLTAADSVQGGGGSDRLVLTVGGTAQLSGVNGVETYRLANVAADTVTLGDGNFAGISGTAITVVAGNAGDTVNAAAVGAGHRVVFVGGGGRDIFTGGAGADTVEVSASNLGAADRLRGGAGNDRLVLLGAGAVTVTGVAGIETIVLSSAAKNTLALTDANFSGVSGRTVTVTSGNDGDTITAILPAKDKLVLHGGTGNDSFDLSASTLAAAKVTGGQGVDRLVVTTPGALAAAGVSGVETYVLADGGADSLTLVTGNFAGITGNAITVVGGNTGNRISEAAVAADLVTMKGGAGSDTLITGPHAVMTGGGSSDLFEFTSPGTSAGADRNTVTDFAHGTDKLGLSNAGFHLGLAKGGATPRLLPAALFSPKANGTFDKPSERFAYDAGAGRLYFDADGNGASHSRQLVATLAGHPAVTAGDLFFVA